jgi:hypothetical protein
MAARTGLNRAFSGDFTDHFMFRIAKPASTHQPGKPLFSAIFGAELLQPKVTGSAAAPCMPQGARLFRPPQLCYQRRDETIGFLGQ